MSLPSRLLAKLRHHVGREVDALESDAAGRQREPDPAGADRELERRAVAGQLGEEGHRLVLVASQVAVVLLGRLAQKALDRVVVLHRVSFPQRARYGRARALASLLTARQRLRASERARASWRISR